MLDLASLLVIAGVTKYFSCGLVFTDFVFMGNMSALFSLFKHVFANLKDKVFRLDKSVSNLVIFNAF